MNRLLRKPYLAFGQCFADGLMKDTERKESMAAGDDEPPSKAPIDTHSQDGPNPAAPTCVSRAKGILIKAYDLACEHWFILGERRASGAAGAVSR